MIKRLLVVASLSSVVGLAVAGDFTVQCKVAKVDVVSAMEEYGSAKTKADTLKDNEKKEATKKATEAAFQVISSSFDILSNKQNDAVYKNGKLDNAALTGIEKDLKAIKDENDAEKKAKAMFDFVDVFNSTVFLPVPVKEAAQGWTAGYIATKAVTWPADVLASFCTIKGGLIAGPIIQIAAVGTALVLFSNTISSALGREDANKEEQE